MGEHEKNKVVVKILRNRILLYSAKKMNTNVEDLYSVLNPDTNSDSPSLKSKGVRFDSAIQIVIHIKKTGASKRVVGELEKFILLENDSDEKIIKIIMITMAKTTS